MTQEETQFERHPLDLPDIEPQSDKVRELEEKIIWLQGELERERRRSMSLWDSFRTAFLKEGNSEEQADYWASEIASHITRWINSQRQEITKRVQLTGSLPPYTSCLNDLSISLTPPGEPIPEPIEPLNGQVAIPSLGIDYSQMQPQQPQSLYSSTLSFIPQPPPSTATAPQAPYGPPSGDKIHPKVNVPRPFASIPGATSTVNVPTG